MKKLAIFNVILGGVLQALATPVIQSMNPTDLTERAGDHVAFVVSAAGSGALSYQWYANNVALTGQTNATLILTNIQTSNSGSYWVTVEDSTLVLVSNYATLNVSANYLPFYPGNIVVARVGDGVQTLSSNTGNTLYLDQYQTNGTYVSTIQIPDEPTGWAYGHGSTGGSTNLPVANPALLVDGGSSYAGTEAYLTVSYNQEDLAFVGYCLAYPFSGTDVTAEPGGIGGYTWRSIGEVNTYGIYSVAVTNTGLFPGSPNKVRSAVSLDGITNFWVTGAAGSVGVKYDNSTLAPLLPGQIDPGSSTASGTGCEVVEILNNSNLVYSDGVGSGSGTHGLYYNTNTPEPTGTNNYTSTMIMNEGGQPNDFAFSPDLRTVYIADSQIFTNGAKSGGIQRWDTTTPFSGYTYSYTLQPMPGLTNGAQGLTVTFPTNITSWGPGTNGAVLYATSCGAASNSLVRMVDTGSNSVATVLVTAGPNQALRGVRLSPTNSVPNVPVFIAIQPASQTNTVGNNVTFSVTASGTPPYTYQWQSNSVAIAGATNATLTLSGVRLSYAASYSVVVSNLVSSTATSSNAVLTVNPLPVFLTGTRSYDGTTGAGAAILTVANSIGTDIVTVVSGSGVLAGAGAGAESLTSVGTLALGGAQATNYTLLGASGSARIIAEPLTITANGASKPYGQTDSYGAGSTNFNSIGLVNEETIGTVTITASGGAGGTASLGTYTLMPSAATGGTFNSNNYSIVYEAGILVVSQAPLLVTANNLSMTYGSSVPTLTASYTGLVNGDTTNALGGSPALSTSATSSSPVGTYTISATNGTLNDANYTYNFTNGTLTIGGATLTVSANSLTNQYGSVLPPLTVSYNGFINGDTTNVLTGNPTVTTTAVTNSQVANTPYPITVTQNTLNTANYVFSFVQGGVTMVPAPLGVTADNLSMAYGSNVPTLTASYTGFVNGENTNVLGGSAGLDTIATSNSLIGIYSISATNGTLSDSNYSYSFTNGTLTVVGRIAPPVLTERAGDHVAFVVSAAGSGALSYQWYANNVALTGQTNATLILTNIQTSNSGSYWVTVEDSTLVLVSNYATLNVSANYLPFYPGNIVVARVGDGVQTLSSNTGNTLYLDQYQTNGTYVSTIQIPDEPTGWAYGHGSTGGSTNLPVANPALLVDGGSSYAGTEAYLTVSYNQEDLAFVGYCLAYPFSGTDVTAEPGGIGGYTWRSIGEVNTYGIYSVAVTNTGLFPGSPNKVRSAVSLDGITNFWVTGAAGSVGVKYDNSTLAPLLPGQIDPGSSTASGTGCEVVEILNNSNLVYSDGVGSGSGTHGLYYNTNTPEPTGTNNYTSTMIMNEGGQPNDFAFSPDLRTVYIADSQIFTNGAKSGGIQRWDTTTPFSGYTYSYTLQPMPGLTNGAQGLTVTFPTNITSWGPGTNGAVLYATSCGAASNSLVRMVDTGSNSVATVLVTAGPNQALRGVRLSPTNSVPNVPVFIAIQPASQTNTVGNNVTFSVTASGTPPYTYQWQSNSVAIAGATNATLTLSGVRLSYAASYSVVVSNLVSSTATSSNAVLTVNPLPVFLTGTRSYDGTTGAGAAILTVANSIGTDIVTVVSGSGVLAGAGAGAESLTSVGTLALGGAQATNYTLLGASGSARIIAAQLGVTANNVSMIYGTIVPTLTASYAGFVNGENPSVLEGSAGLSTSATSSSPVGTYTISATNGTLNDANYTYNFTNGTLTIGVAAMIISNNPFPAESFLAGYTATFTGTGTGVLPCSGYWQANTGAGWVTLSNGGNISGATTVSSGANQMGTLLINNVSASNAGSYQLVITNSSDGIIYASTSAVVTLSIVPAPSSGSFAAAALSYGPVAFWPLNETDDPSTGLVEAFDVVGGFNGYYGVNAQDGGFNDVDLLPAIAGPQPPNYDGFSSNNGAWGCTSITNYTTFSNTFVSTVSSPTLPTTATNATIVAWVNPLAYSAHAGNTALLIMRGGAEVCGFRYGGTNGSSNLSYIWDNTSTNAKDFNSGLIIPTNTWSMLAMVITPSNSVLYLGNSNGISSATQTITNIYQTMGYPLAIGGDLGAGNDPSLSFVGEISSVLIYTNSLSTGKIENLLDAGFAITSISINSQPQAETVNDGGMATFTASAQTVAMDTPVTYAWYKGSVMLTNGLQSSGSTASGAQGTNSEFFLTATLTLTNISYLDEGNYSLYVTNSVSSSVSSSAAALTVNDPAILTQPPAIAEVAPGSNIAIGIVAAGSGTLTYQWVSSSAGSLTNGGVFSGVTTSNLTISGAQLTDMGTYYVTVTGVHGTVQSSNVNLYVDTAVSGVTITPSILIQQAGTHLAFVGTATRGTGGLVNFIWQLNGIYLTNGTQQDGSIASGADTAALILENIQVADSGTYTLIASNAVSLTSSSNFLMVSAGFLPLSASNLVVARIGDGAQMLNSNTGNTLFLDQYQTNGAYVSTIQIPDESTSLPYGTGSSYSVYGSPALLFQGAGADAGFEAFLTLSYNKEYLCFAGYNLNYPYSGADCTASNIWRGLGEVSAFGFYTPAYISSSIYTGGNHSIRSAISLDGVINFWATGQGVSGGAKYINAVTGSVASDSTASGSGARVVQILNNSNLVYSDWSGTNHGLYYNTNTPEPGSGGSYTSSLLLNDAGQPNDFAFSPDLRTVYIADSESFTNFTQSGGIQRWDTTTPGSNYSWSYTLQSVSGLTNGAQGLTVTFPTNIISWGAGVTGAILYATSFGAASNSLVRIVDMGSGSGATVLATAGPNQALRGVRFGPAVPSSYIPPCGLIGGAVTNGDEQDFTHFEDTIIGRQIDVCRIYHGLNYTNLMSNDLACISNGQVPLIDFDPAIYWSNAVGVANGGSAAVDAQIAQLAQSVASIQPTNIMLCVLHEPDNRHVIGYGGTNGTPSQYAAMWQNVVSIFDANGATNVIWCWIVENYGTSRGLLDELWPGNSYVDWVMWDPYQDSESPDITTIIQGGYDWFVTNSTPINNYVSKPWGLAEWGIGNNGWIPSAETEAAEINLMTATVNDYAYPWSNLQFFEYFNLYDSALQPGAFGAYSNFANSAHFPKQVPP